MPTLGYATGSIAGVNLTSGGVDCKTEIIDGANLQLGRVGSVVVAASGAVRVQTIVTSYAPFGVLVFALDATARAGIISAIQTALDADLAFNVTLADGVHSLNLSVVPDFSQQWISYPAQRMTAFLSDVLFRFLVSP